MMVVVTVAGAERELAPTGVEMMMVTYGDDPPHEHVSDFALHAVLRNRRALGGGEGGSARAVVPH